MSQSGEKTEKATPKKRSDAREKGQVVVSKDMNAALQLIGFYLFFRIMSESFGSKMQGIFTDLMPAAGQRQPLTINGVSMFYREAATAAFGVLAPLLALTVGVALMTNLVQTRMLITTKTFSVKPDRINPVQGLKRMFSSRSVVELVKALLKIAIIIFAVYQEYSVNIQDFSKLVTYSATASIELVAGKILKLTLRCILILLVLGGFDYLYQWWKNEKELRMTKQEVKDEYKKTEGNPQIKGRIRQTQRMMASRRMMQDVPDATVVLANPTHVAVALRYNAGDDEAPTIVAKGQNLVAQRIKEIARENGVAVVENRPLARGLYASCEIGTQIPIDMYGAVAEVLAHVTRMKEGGIS